MVKWALFAGSAKLGHELNCKNDSLRTALFKYRRPFMRHQKLNLRLAGVDGSKKERRRGEVHFDETVKLCRDTCCGECASKPGDNNFYAQGIDLDWELLFLRL